MLTNLEFHPVEEVSFEDLQHHVEKLKKGRLSTFVMRSVAPDAAAAFDKCMASFNAVGYKRFHAMPIPFPSPRITNERSTDRALHIDQSMPISEPARDITLHYTRLGQVRARFLPAQPELAERPSIADLTSVYVDLVEGKVDDEIFEPIGYETIVNPTDMVVFKLRGGAPLAHEFESLTVPRNSLAIDLSLTLEKQG